MAVKLDGLSHKELQSLIAQAESKIESARAKLIEDVRQKIDVLLHAEGLQLADVYLGQAGKAGKSGKRGKRPGAGIPKYRNPADPAKTWTGFGKRPAWFIAATSKPGITADSLLINGASVARPATGKVAPAKKVAKTVTKKVATKRVARKAVK
ncbi:H-NS histone family protein [Paraburkholderia ginsengisoli]|uniref:H-NS histone family protein n=1 Tax=Paraburkholderia ginsengisoli TaxID=311231 RepID=A0A7T4N330_9BURK|nr:H-NS histone family protein [Paraburkholderia ginsengisoli]QQC64341.1 H-NS histone family protein [Paraburkholderia ginsengisoli]